MDNPVQRLNLHHRGLVGLLVVGIESIVAIALHKHRSLAGAYPREVELRECLDDAPQHLCADIALAGIGVVGYVLCREAALSLEVILILAQTLRLRPANKFAEAEDGG